MKLRIVVIAMALALGVAPVAFALETPEFSAKDHRVRYVNYDDADVIQLDAVIGVATHIQLEEGESLVYHVFGDSEAYEFTHKDNHVFFKPVQEQADTNLTLITNKRSYAFRVSYFNDRQSKALYKLVLRYPDTEAKLSAAQAEQAAVRHALANPAGTVNWATYTKSGDVALAPVHAWDDGKHTWMQFAAQTDLPAIYLVGSDGQEVITNYHMADSHTVVLHRTSPKWHLRLGAQVVAIHNGGFGQVPITSDTGTVSPEVKRVIRGEPEVQTDSSPSAPAAKAPPTRQFNPTETLSTQADMAHSQTYAVAKSPKESTVESQPVATPDVPKAPTTSAPAPTEAPAAAAAAPTINPSVGGFQVQSGDPALLPSKVWTVGNDTFFQFATGDIPVIAPIDSDGKEQLAGLRADPKNIIVMHATSDRWVLRKGANTVTLIAKEKTQ